MLALMGKLVIVALVFEGFSVDSFALPIISGLPWGWSLPQVYPISKLEE